MIHYPVVLDLEKAKSDQAIEIASLKKRVDKLEKRRKFRTTGLKRLKKVGAAIRIKSSNDSLGAQEDASKQWRRIEDIDADAEVFVDVTTVEKEEQSTKTGEAITTVGVEDSAAPIITTAGVKDSAIPTIPITVEETLAQTLMEIKAAKPKSKGIVFHDQEEQLEAELIEEERKERQKEEEANIALIESWENIQAMMKADRLLAERLQTSEREELTNEEKGKLFMELESSEKKVEGSKEKAKSSRNKMLGKKRAVKEEQQESPKIQKLEDDKETNEHEEVEADDTAELKKHLVIKKDDDIAIDAILLAVKPPVIVDYKLLKEGIMTHYQLIRADGSFKRYSSMSRMLQGIDRKDLQTL
ncbi:hypothetical protein Tco_1467588 [Tanacetum coccineum]